MGNQSFRENMIKSERKDKKRVRLAYEASDNSAENVVAESETKRRRVYIQQQKMQNRVKYMDKFQKEHDGYLPSLNGVMKSCRCGYQKAKQTVMEYAKAHHMQVKDVERIMIVRHNSKDKNKE